MSIASVTWCSDARTLGERSVQTNCLLCIRRVDFYGFHLRTRRPVLRPFDQALQCLITAFDHGLDAAVAAVAHPAGQAQAARFCAHAVTKPYALHVSGNFQMYCWQLNNPACFERVQFVFVNAGEFAQYAGCVLAK